ncbi:MAG: DDE-type integrase/transposase/recombinase [Candidatus Micrarchaeota archaeon]|nr:DDE-type integrase/transposase/recombinase [Candidatus Micrarchaeota archaeon]
MKHLKQPQINRICRQMNARLLSVWRIAKIAKITPRWARKIYASYLETGRPPVLRKCGRPATPTSEALAEKVIREYHEVSGSALELEQRLKRQGIRLSHNRIHRVLRDAHLAKREVKKSKRRKWVRYERRKANSLWHADWKKLDGKHMVLFEDDATRLITGHGLFDRQSAELSLQVFALAVEKWGVPRQLLTDNGAEFCNTHERKDDRHVFYGGVQRAGCTPIHTRPAHPQCNGKLEKLNHTISRLYWHFGGDLDAAVAAYNQKKLHMSLDWKTPMEVWNAKTAKGLKYEKLTKT